MMILVWRCSPIKVALELGSERREGAIAENIDYFNMFFQSLRLYRNRITVTVISSSLMM